MASESELWVTRLRRVTVDTAVQLSCYSNEKRRPCYRLVSLLCIISCIALFILASRQASSTPHHSMQYRRSLLHHTEVPKYDRPFIRNSKLVKPFNFKVVTEPMNSFKSCKDTYLLIVVCSAPGHKDRRNAIRETWGSQKSVAHLKTAVVFALGVDDKVDKEIDLEIAAHGDILRGDFMDTYANLTLKSTMMLKYAATACEGRAGPQFVMKTDDDIFVNVPLLISSLKEQYGPLHRVITGCIKQRGSPKAIHPQGLTPPPAWPEFAAGAGYVFSGKLAPELYMAARRVGHPARPEDVFVTAQCARLVPGAHPPRHDTRFSCGGAVLDDCRLVSMFSGHHISPQRQIAIWDKFSSDPNPCMDF
ncbi:hypothetical protein B566_EDAN015506 [Ephemera danica]|nr:hypothetical protein B566_EDAN015506 [Ephemera danica]